MATINRASSGGMTGSHGGHWEQRWHPLRREWVVVAAHRDRRPWSGERESRQTISPPAFDPSCPLCPGNLRAAGKRNPPYRGVHVFENDYPVVSSEAPAVSGSVDPHVTGSTSDGSCTVRSCTAGAGDGESGGAAGQDGAAGMSIYRRRAARGISRVICYDPRHNVHLADLPVTVTRRVLAAWRDQDRELSGTAGIRHALIFENRGATVGVSNPHPHGQLYAVNFVFRLVEREIEACRAYAVECGRSLFDAILEAELDSGLRLLAQNQAGVAFVPFFARYAYEVMIVPRLERARLSELDDADLEGLANLLHHVVRLYDGLFGMPFPYVLAVHQAPYGGARGARYRLHFELQPPLRRPGLKKHLAGPEIGGGNFMSDTWPEEKAAELRAVAGAWG